MGNIRWNAFEKRLDEIKHKELEEIEKRERLVEERMDININILSKLNSFEYRLKEFVILKM